METNCDLPPVLQKGMRGETNMHVRESVGSGRKATGVGLGGGSRLSRAWERAVVPHPVVAWAQSFAQPHFMLEPDQPSP
jgi:hypothetical protein